MFFLFIKIQFFWIFREVVLGKICWKMLVQKAFVFCLFFGLWQRQLQRSMLFGCSRLCRVFKQEVVRKVVGMMLFRKIFMQMRVKVLFSCCVYVKVLVQMVVIGEDSLFSVQVLVRQMMWGFSLMVRQLKFCLKMCFSIIGIEFSFSFSSSIFWLGRWVKFICWKVYRKLVYKFLQE